MAEEEEIKSEGEDEDSMEDILHSIRDIIADEDEETPAEGEKSTAEDIEETPDDATEDDEEVLDLTEVAEEEVPAESAETKPTEKAEVDKTEDVLDDIDTALEEIPAPAEGATKPSPEPVIAPPSEDALLDKTKAAASSSAMKTLVDSVPRPNIERKDFRSGNTVEDLALEALKPMLKGWLDGNLEPLVREIVEREIKKLLPRD